MDHIYIAFVLMRGEITLSYTTRYSCYKIFVIGFVYLAITIQF